MEGKRIGTEKSFRSKARDALGVRRTRKYVGMTRDEVQRSRCAFFEAAMDVKENRWAK
jgi:hypothetical protein